MTNGDGIKSRCYLNEIVYGIIIAERKIECQLNQRKPVHTSRVHRQEV